MDRRWITGPRGSDYLVVAGKRAHVVEASELATPSVHLFGSPIGVLARRLHLRREGLVEVRWRDDVWTWRTRGSRDALAAGEAVCNLIVSGMWVPQDMPQPELPRATFAGHSRATSG